MATPVAVDPAPAPPAVDGAAAEADFLSMALLLLATLAATVTYSAGLSPPGGFWRDGGLLARDPVLRVTYPRRYRAFFYFNATAFVASLVAVVVLLLQRNQRIRRRTLLAAMTLDFVCLIGTFAAAAGGYGRTTYVVALVAAVLSFAVIKLLVFLYYLVKKLNLIDEALQRHLQFGRLEHRIHEEHQSRASERADDDAYKILRKSHKYLLLLGTLSATITYQAGLSPPGGFWQDNAAAADGRTHNFAGDPVLHITYHRRYLVFFYCNATAFVASLVILLLLLSNIFSTTQRIKYCALQATMILDLFGLIGAYAAGSCRQLVYVSVLVVSAFLYVGFHVFMKKVFPASSEAPREKMAPCVPGLSKPAYQVHAEGDEAMERKLEKTRELLLLLAILAASLTYQAGMSPPGPGGLWQENNSGHVVGDPVVNDNSRRRYKAFFYCKAMSFVASLVITVLLVNKRLSAGGIRSHALQVCLIIGLMGAYGAGAGTYRKISMVDVLLLFLAVIVCISLQIASLVSGSARGPVQRLVPKLGWPQVLGVEDDCGSASLSTPRDRDQLVSPLFHGACKVIDSLRSGTWMLVFFFLVIRQPALRQNLKVKFKVSKISAVLGVLLVSASPMTAATTMDTPSTASTGMVRRRRDPPLVKAEDEPTRPRRNRRPNSQLIGGDWVNS